MQHPIQRQDAVWKNPRGCDQASHRREIGSVTSDVKEKTATLSVRTVRFHKGPGSQIIKARPGIHYTAMERDANFLLAGCKVQSSTGDKED